MTFNNFSIATRSLSALALILSPHLASAQDFPGGFIDQAASASVQGKLSQSEIAGFLPSKGKFTFPAPWNTEAVRLTNADDCNGGDCVSYIGYSYWNNINNHVGFDTMLIMVGLNGNGGPSLLQYNKITDEVTNLGPLFDSSHNYSRHSGEGWYFSRTMPTKIYINNMSNTRIERYDVMTKQLETVFDLSTEMPGHILWQQHSSSDDRVHSATVRDAGSYSMVGCMAYEEDTGEFHYFPSEGSYDECQIDKSGRWLVIKDNIDGQDGEDNRIIDLATGNERILLDRDGAAGHSDLGYGYMIAADNFASVGNTQKVWDFTAPTLQGITAYANGNWGASAPAHISHTNSLPGVPMNQQYACGSSASSSNAVHANEVICFRMDNSGDVLVVAPTMTDMGASGGGDSYGKAPKGNLDVTGRYFIWSSNMGGDRLDVFLVKVPGQLLSGAAPTLPSNPVPMPEPTPLPEPEPEPAPQPEPQPQPEPEPVTPVPAGEVSSVVWTEVTNATVDGDSLVKADGSCDGCGDAGALSQQQILEGDGFLEFTAPATGPMLMAGLTHDLESMDFALRLQSGTASVNENGAWRAETTFTAGDVFRVSVQDGKVSYARNGTVFHTSTAVPTFPLRADVTLFSLDSAISDAKIAMAQASQPETPPADGGSEPVVNPPAPAPAPAPAPEPAPAPAPAPVVNPPAPSPAPAPAPIVTPPAAPALPVLESEAVYGGGATTATIAAGTSAGGAFKSEFVASEIVSVEAEIKPEAAHANQPGELFAIVKVTPPAGKAAWYFKNEDGRFENWDGVIAHLRPLKSLGSLGLIQKLDVNESTLRPGEYKVFFGYMAEGGSLIYNNKPLSFTVSE